MQVRFDSVVDTCWLEAVDPPASSSGGGLSKANTYTYTGGVGSQRWSLGSTPLTLPETEEFWTVYAELDNSGGDKSIATDLFSTAVVRSLGAGTVGGSDGNNLAVGIASLNNTIRQHIDLGRDSRNRLLARWVRQNVDESIYILK